MTADTASHNDGSNSNDKECNKEILGAPDSPNTVAERSIQVSKGRPLPLAPSMASSKSSEAVVTSLSSSSSSSLPSTAITSLSDLEYLKQQAGYKAVDDYLRSGQVIGLGTGSTACYAVERVGQKVRSGELRDIICIPTSERTKEQALSLDIPLTTLNTHPIIDVAIDGADEVDLQSFHLIKGGGGAFLREKMVEICANKFIVIVDETKICSEGLGSNGYPIPIEITPFCYQHTIRTIMNLPSIINLSCKPVLRMGSSTNNKPDGDTIAVTDNGNYIVDLHFHEPLIEVPQLAREVKNIVGVIEHGLFCHMASAVIIASQKEGVQTVVKESS